jgi:hypothetical protein
MNEDDIGLDAITLVGETAVEKNDAEGGSWSLGAEVTGGEPVG